jgi:hypothetical protein
MVDVYARAEAMLRTRLAGRRSDFRERCILLAMWLLRMHGPYGSRVFPVPPIELAADERFRERVGLTYSQIRTAAEALQSAGLLERISPQRTERRRKDPPVQFVIGPDFATLFPAAQCAAAEAAAQYSVARSAPNLSPVKRTLPGVIQAPLFVATWKNPIPRPMRWQPPAPKTERDLAIAHLTALKERMKAEPPPMLSAAALRAGGFR